MKENAKQILILISVLFVLIFPSQLFELHEAELEAAISQAKTLDTIFEKRKSYRENIDSDVHNKLITILIVPGHDDVHYGAKFNNLKEVQLNRELGEHLHTYLSQEPGVVSVLASDSEGYVPIFEKYFESEKENIKEFIQNKKRIFAEKIASEKINLEEENFHNLAPEEMVSKLYGFNRWSNSQDFDLVIHIHFNDYPTRPKGKIGKYSGFSIYTPGKTFENHELSLSFAQHVFSELQKVQKVSNLPSEKKGILEDHELIALGANESLDAGSILVEYGYIYEPQFTNIRTRANALDTLAFATYKGIQNLIGSK